MTYKNKPIRAVKYHQRTGDRIVTAIGFAACFVMILVMVAMTIMTGCSPSSRTRVDPASTNATHSTVEQNAGRTRTETIKLRIQPNDPAAAPQGAATPASGVGGGGDAHSADQLASLADDTPSERRVPNWSRSGGGAVISASWGGNRTRDQPEDTRRVDASGLAETLRSAVDRGSVVDFEYTTTDNTPLTTNTVESTLDDRGAGLLTSSDEAAIGFDGKRGGTDMPYGGKSGKSSFGLDASLLTRATNPLVILGGIVLLGAIVPVLMTPRRFGAAATIAGMGLLLIAAGVVATEMPWIFVVVLLAFIGFVVWQGWELWKRRGVQDTLDTVVRGVEETNATHASVVKGRIGAIAESNGKQEMVVKNEVRKSKVRQGLRKKGTG